MEWMVVTLLILLLEKGYEVFGMERRTSTPNRTNSWHLEGKITFLSGDLN